MRFAVYYATTEAQVLPCDKTKTSYPKLILSKYLGKRLQPRVEARLGQQSVQLAVEGAARRLQQVGRGDPGHLLDSSSLDQQFARARTVPFGQALKYRRHATAV